MSQLETRAKPVIEPLLENGAVVFATNDQRTLATRAIKSAMVYEGLRLNQPCAFTYEERTRLRESLTLPPRTKAWIAKCVHPPGPYCEASDLSGEACASDYLARAYVTTTGFGPLVIQVVNFRLTSVIPLSVDITADLRAGPWDSLATQVWPDPCHVASWPPTMGLEGEAGLEAFHKRWSPEQA